MDRDIKSFKKDMEMRIENGLIDGAINRTKAQLVKYPDKGELHYILGRAYFEKGDFQESERYLRLGQAYNQDNLDYYYLKFELKLESGKYEEARQIIKEISQIDLNLDYKNKAEIKLLMAEERYGQALEILELEDKNTFIKERLKCLYETGDFDGCKKLANKTRLKSPNSKEGILSSEYLLKIKADRIEREKNASDLDKYLLKLNRLIGLGSVKHEVNRIIGAIRFKQNREKLGIVVDSSHSYHMAFYGNPGTGKTTVARLLGDIYRELGILEKGHLVEVDRSGLVEGYIGQTAKTTKKVIESAYGGILFIDEAYSLARGGENDFGREAIDTLLKEMEDNRDKFIVILAGYTNEMKELFKLNPGLRSRLSTEIYFEDYNTEELLEIGRLIAGENKYKLTKTGEIGFLQEIEREKMDDFFSNARACRNLIESAIREKAYRLGNRILSKEEMTSLDAIDFGVDLSRNFHEDIDLQMEKLNRLIGLSNVKTQVEEIKQLIIANKEREEQNLPINNLSYHMMFTGNPGTGKTTVARIIGGIFKSLGLLSKGHVVEVDRSDLVGGYIGQTGPKTMEIIKSAYGGILFIDEAYSLARGGENDFGREAIDTLIKEMEDNRDRFVVILAGYEDEMRQLLKLNPGLESRIRNKFHFEDYSQGELLDIGRLIVADKGYILREDGERAFLKKLGEERDLEHFSNARACRNIIEAAIMKNAMRVGGRGLSREEISTLSPEDFGVELDQAFKDDLDLHMESLDKLVGLEGVKTSINQIKNMVILNERRERQGISVDKASYHMIFTGNPGTGKTSVARILGDIFRSLGLLSKGQLVEVDRSDLVGEYVGQTAGKTLDVIKSAYGGILFIDEAYSLDAGTSNDFGKEALSTLIKEMEDNRDKFIVILAGYTKEMEGLLDLNPGLKSRIGKLIEFEDYTREEMYEIFKIFLEAESYYLAEDAAVKAREYIAQITDNKDKHFGNGRTARNIFEELKLIQAERVVEDLDADILEIRVEDLEKLS